MKRKEAVEYIASILEVMNKENLFGKDGPEFCADMVLTYLQVVVGMKPPEVRPIPQYVIDNYGSVYYWEPEND